MKIIVWCLSFFVILFLVSLLLVCVFLGNVGFGGFQQNFINQFLNMIDEVICEGMFVVLVLVFMFNKSVMDFFSYLYWVIFKNKDVFGIVYMQVFVNNDLEKIKEVVYLWDFFEVNIVLLGIYLLFGGIDYKIDSIFVQIKVLKGQLVVSLFGLVNLFVVLYCWFVKENYWCDVFYVDKIYIQNVCSVVYMVFG